MKKLLLSFSLLITCVCCFAEVTYFHKPGERGAVIIDNKMKLSYMSVFASGEVESLLTKDVVMAVYNGYKEELDLDIINASIVDFRVYGEDKPVANIHVFTAENFFTATMYLRTKKGEKSKKISSKAYKGLLTRIKDGEKINIVKFYKNAK